MSQNSSLTAKGQGFTSVEHSSHGDVGLEIERLQSELSMSPNRDPQPAPVSNSLPQRFQNSPANDEIDLLDLMRTLWGLRFFALGGAIVGALAALTILPIFVKTRYVTTFPVAMDVKSLPAISEPDRVVATLNAAFGTSLADTLFESKVMEAFPELKSTLSASDAENDTLFSGRSAKNMKDLPIFIENGIGTNQYILSVTLPLSVPDTNKLEVTIINALNALIQSRNSQAEELHEADARARFDDAIRLQTSATTLLQDFAKGYEGLVQTAGQIQATELRLMALSKKLGSDSLSYLKDFQPEDRVTREDQLGAVPPSHTLVYKDASRSLSRSFATLALLSDQKIISPEQDATFRSTLLSLQQNIDSEYNQVQTQQRISEVAMSRVSEALRQRSEPVNRATQFLPSFLVPEQSIADPEIEQQAKPSKSMTLALSVLLCGMLGVMIGFAVTILPNALKARAEASGDKA